MAVLGLEVLTWVALLLLVGGVVGSIVPLIPGAGLSLVGVYLYWWHMGYTEPHILILLALTLGGLAAMVVDLLAGAIATRASGADTRTQLAAALAGTVLFFVAGPLGILVGIGAVVFVVEYGRGGDATASVRTAAYAVAGVLASAVVQFLVTFSMLVVMVLVILI